MAYDAAKPADTQFISAGPGDIRTNQEALRTGQIVDALKLKGYSPGNASGNVPVSNGTLCTNLNADKLDGNEATAFATAGHTHSAATTSSNGLMSNTDKAKLDGITTGAQPNQSAFANIVIDSTTMQADSATDTFTMVSGANITLTPDAANDKVTVAVTGPIPVANGGTGATTAAAALTNLGLTATAAELNHLYGITSTVAELNIMHGVTATAAEINFVDGVTSNVQTQLNAKAPTSHAVAATTYGIGTASVYGHAAASSATPLVAGTAAVGTDNGKYARENHVHPLQTSVSGASGSCTGNAATATKLATARTISLTGAVTGSVTFDGSTNASILTSAGSVGSYDAAHSFAANGYQKLGNGLIIQWGILTKNSVYVSGTFPIAFPSACVSMSIGSIFSSGIVYTETITALSQTGFTIGSSNTSPGYHVTYIAIGY